MLDTNNLKRNFNVRTYEAEKGIEKLVEKSKRPNSHGFPSLTLVVVAPPNILSPMGSLAVNVDETIDQSQHFHQHYQDIAIHNKCLFFHSAGILQPNEIDGMNLYSHANEQLAHASFHFLQDRKNSNFMF